MQNAQQRIPFDDAAAALPVTYDDVLAASRVIAGAVERTPLRVSRTLSQITGAEVYLKFENLQFTAAFKERGALNRLLGLGAAERRAGVIAMSAGNHAQAVAYHASRLGIAATIVMPRNTPFVKVCRTRELGAEVVLHGASLREADAHAHELASAQGLTFVHPYDDPLVIAGQGTVALEMLEDAPDLEVLLVPIGGGGLVSGMAVAAKAIKPDIEVIGVEAESFPAMHGRLRGLDGIGGGATLAEGIAVTRVGRLTEQIVRALIDDLLLVSEERLESALSLLLNVEKSLTEGAGAAGLAALLAAPDRFAGRRVGLVLSGGNIDQRLLSTVLMRDLVRKGRMAQLRVAVPDAPGELGRLTSIIGAEGGNIVEVILQRTFAQISAKVATAQIDIETRDAQQMEQILQTIIDAGYDAQLLQPDI